MLKGSKFFKDIIVIKYLSVDAYNIDLSNFIHQKHISKSIYGENSG